MSTFRLFCFVFACLIHFNLFSQYSTPIVKDHNAPFLSNFENSTSRTMAEWEEVEYLLLSWVQYPSTLREIVRHAQEAATVLIICNDSAEVISFLKEGKVVINNISFIYANPNSVWIREYGPQTIYRNGVDSLALVDWVYNRPRSHDDQLSQVIAQKLGIPLLSTAETPDHLVNIGGNFLTDGMGTAFRVNSSLKKI